MPKDNEPPKQPPSQPERRSDERGGGPAHYRKSAHGHEHLSHEPLKPIQHYLPEQPATIETAPVQPASAPAQPITPPKE